VVKGTFDDPPVVIRQDRLKISLICLAMAVLIVLLYWRHPPSDDCLVWWLPLGLLAAVIGWSVIARGALILAPEGLVWRMAFLTLNGVTSRGSSWFRVGESRSQECIMKAAKRRRPWFFRGLGSIAFGASWELPPQRIADVLNEARTRWGPKGAAS
jgi:hypothetical protein